MTKKVSLQYKIHLEYRCTYNYSSTVSPLQAAIIENEQQISRVPSYLVWTSFNEIKKLIFKANTDVYFS